MSEVADKTKPSWAWVDRVDPYLSLFDFSKKPDSKVGWGVRVVATALALTALYTQVHKATKPLLSAKPPSPIPTEEIEDYKFKLPERVRREMFAEIAAAELAERARAIQGNTWGGHAWSREDDRGWYEKLAVRSVAAKHKVSISQGYLVLDEGIREHWEAPNGEPLPATTPALDIRTNSW